MAYQPTPQSVISTVNSSATPLGISGVFTGTSEDVSQYASATVLVFTDQASATDGLSIQQSSNGTNWDSTDVYTVAITTAGNAKPVAVQVNGNFFRVVYTNGAVAQTTFRLQTIYHYIAPPTSSVRPQDARTNDNDMQESLAYAMLFNGTTFDRMRGDITNGLDVDVTRLPSIPTGANTIGAVTGTGTFSVQTTAQTPGTAATNLGKAEDAAHASGDVGVMSLSVRNDNAATSQTSANGDYAAQVVDTNGTQFVRDAPSNTAALANVAGSVTSVTLQAANAARRSLVIYNDSTSDVYIKYGTPASSTSFTIYLPSLATTTILGSEYAGIVTGIWVSATGNARLTETSI